MSLRPVEPIFIADVYARLHEELISLLESLAPEDWYKPTAAGQWQVRDLVAHLLDSDLRRLSFQRDKAPMAPPHRPIHSYRDLVDFLNDLNAEWVRAAKRISPQLLIQFHKLTGPQVCGLINSLDPFAPALFGVAWAGEEHSQNWFDLAREYTEKWHHQQQIRDAVLAAPLADRKWLFPVLDTFLRGLPHTFREVEAANETQIAFEITGDAGGEWTLQREENAWKLYAGQEKAPACAVRMNDDTAWRLMTKGLAREEAESRISIEGDASLGAPILGMLAIMG